MTHQSAVWRATLDEDYEMADQLVRDGADVCEPVGPDAACDPTLTLLHLAAMLGGAERVRLLIEHGAQCAVYDKAGCTPLHWAILNENDDAEIIQLLIEGGCPVDTRNLYDCTPLYCAVKRNFINCSRVLINKGACINTVVNDRSLLQMAVTFGFDEMVKLLVRPGIDIDYVGNCESTALRYAVTSGKRDIIKLLLDNGADVNKRVAGLFPLYIGASSLDPESLLLLLERGARVNDRTVTGNTALFNVCLSGNIEAGDLLFEYGADINIRNHEGKSIFDLIGCIHPNEDIGRFIITEVVKLKALGKPICTSYQRLIQAFSSFAKFEKECTNEMNEIKNHMFDVDDSTASYFHIFSKNVEELARLLRNKTLFDAFNEDECLSLFEIYGECLLKRLRKAKERLRFLLQAEYHLLPVFDEILPLSIIQRIAGYLKLGDIVSND